MILVKFSHSENAKFPIVVTLSGIVTLLRFLQLKNAIFQIVVMLFGIVTLVKL